MSLDFYCLPVHFCLNLYTQVNPDIIIELLPAIALIIFEGIVKAPIEAVLMNGIDLQTYIIQAKESDNTQDIGQHKNASIQKTDWLVDDLYKLKPKAKRLIWEQKCTGDWELRTKKGGDL